LWQLKKTGIILVAVFFALLAITGSASAATLYVDDDGTAQYKTIQDAVNHASNGDTIIVQSGTYKETVNMASSGLTFLGKSYPKVNGFVNWVDDQGGFGTQTENINGFSIMRDGVSIGGRYGGGNIVRNNYFYSCGVEIGDGEWSTDNTIMNNEFNGGGISLWHSTAKITGNRIYKAKNGIYLGYEASCDEISGNTISGCDVGLYITGLDDYFRAGAGEVYNNVFNNTVNAKLEEYAYVEKWTKDPVVQNINIVGGPSIGGNFWGSPNGKGFSQVQADSNGDGFADYPYVISKGNVDNLPLVSPVKIPSADFSASKTSGNAPLTVTFTDKSIGSPTSWKWSFGDGSPLVTQYNPTYTYSKPGTYTVKETVSNAAGKDTEIKTNYITVTAPLKAPVAALSASPTSGNAPLKVQFTDKSTNSPTSWKWSFGDGTYSTEKNPAHTYSKTGKYTVTLTVKNAAGSNTVTKSSYISVAAPPKVPVAAFSAFPTSGKTPLKVQFTDKSTNSPTSWKWSFGDGTYSTSKNPSHTYSKAGKYTVYLTAKNAAGSNTKTMSGYITVKSK